MWGLSGVTYCGPIRSHITLPPSETFSILHKVGVHTKLRLLPPTSRNGRRAAVINSKKQAALRRTNVAGLQIARNALQKNADCCQRAAEGEADWLHQLPDDIPPGEVHTQKNMSESQPRVRRSFSSRGARRGYAIQIET